MSNPNIPPGPGRPKGSPNKASGDIRDIIAQITKYLDTQITIPALIDEIWGSAEFVTCPKCKHNVPLKKKMMSAKLLDFIAKIAPKDINLGGQGSNPIIIATPEEKSLMEGQEPDAVHGKAKKGV